MNKDYKENLLKLKNYLILTSMIGSITLLPGCTGQKPDEQNNKQTANIENETTVKNDSNLNKETIVLLALDNGNYIIYDCDNCIDDSTKYTVNINDEMIPIPNSNVVRLFFTDEYGNAHKKAEQYVYETLHIDSDGFNSNRIIDYDDEIQPKYKKKK